MSSDILKELDKLTALSHLEGAVASSSKKSKAAPSTGSSACIPQALGTLEASFESAQSQILDGIDAGDVVRGLLNEVEKTKGGVDRGLKDWYSALGKLGKSIDKVRLSGQPAALLNRYQLCPLSSHPEIPIPAWHHLSILRHPTSRIPILKLRSLHAILHS